MKKRRFNNKTKTTQKRLSSVLTKETIIQLNPLFTVLIVWLVLVVVLRSTTSLVRLAFHYHMVCVT